MVRKSLNSQAQVILMWQNHPIKTPPVFVPASFIFFSPAEPGMPLLGSATVQSLPEPDKLHVTFSTLKLAILKRSTKDTKPIIIMHIAASHRLAVET